MNIAANIKKARKAAGISQKELAEYLQVYQKDISRWENGERTPSLETFAKICKKLNVSADELLEISTENTSTENCNFSEEEKTKETYWELSENYWEYAGNITIKSKNIPKKLNDTTIEVDGVTIVFDEEIRTHAQTKETKT